jgi:hypothetical protein
VSVQDQLDQIRSHNFWNAMGTEVRNVIDQLDAEGVDEDTGTLGAEVNGVHVAWRVSNMPYPTELILEVGLADDGTTPLYTFTLPTEWLLGDAEQPAPVEAPTAPPAPVSEPPAPEPGTEPVPPADAPAEG